MSLMIYKPLIIYFKNMYNKVKKLQFIYTEVIINTISFGIRHLFAQVLPLFLSFESFMV